MQIDMNRITQRVTNHDLCHIGPSLSDKGIKECVSCIAFSGRHSKSIYSMIIVRSIDYNPLDDYKYRTILGGNKLK